MIDSSFYYDTLIASTKDISVVDEIVDLGNTLTTKLSPVLSDKLYQQTNTKQRISQYSFSVASLWSLRSIQLARHFFPGKFCVFLYVTLKSKIMSSKNQFS